MGNRKMHGMFVQETQKQMLRQIIREQYTELFKMVNEEKMPVMTMAELRHLAVLQLPDTIHGKDKELLTRFWHKHQQGLI